MTGAAAETPVCYPHDMAPHRTAARRLVTPGIVALIAGTIWAAGCGGKAVVDEPFAGTGGSTSASGTGGTTSTSSTSTSTSTTSGTGGGPGSLCAEACSLIDTCFEEGVDCPGSCTAAIDECVGAQDDFLMCMITDVDSSTCDFSGTCASQLDDLLACKNVWDAGGMCGVDPGGGCQCEVQDMDNNSYETWCSPAGTGFNCTCLFNFQVIGSCVTNAGTECMPFESCCASLFFVPFFPG